MGRQKHLAFAFAPGPGYRYYLFLEGYVNRVTAIALELHSIGVLFESTCRLLAERLFLQMRHTGIV